MMKERQVFMHYPKTIGTMRTRGGGEEDDDNG